MSDKFEVTYGNDDGYVGGDRPQYCDIVAAELDDSMTEQELKNLFWETIEEDFKQNHMNLYSEQEEEFIAWAKDKIAQMKED